MTLSPLSAIWRVRWSSIVFSLSIPLLRAKPRAARSPNASIENSPPPTVSMPARGRLSVLHRPSYGSCPTVPLTPTVRSKFEAAQYHHEGLREALPLALCRPPASFRTHAHGRTWLARAAELLDLALVARPAAGALAAALDAALARRQAFVERKRLQLVEFMPLGLELAYDGT